MTCGAVFFGHLGSEEHGEECRRGVGLSRALEEQDIDLFGVFEDGYFEPLVEAEGVFGLPLPGFTDRDACGARGVGEGMSLGVLVEVEGLLSPCVAVLGGEVAEADAEV